MLSSPPGCSSSIAPNPKKFDQALTESNHTRYADNEWNQKRATTATIGSGSAGGLGGQHHASRNKKITKNFRITGQNVGQNNVTEFPVLHLRQPTKADSLQGRQEMNPARSRHALDRHNKAENEEQEVRLRQDLPGECGSFGAMCDSPEEEERGGERDRNECGQSVCRLMVKNAVSGLTRGISNQCRNVLGKKESAKVKEVECVDSCTYDLDQVQIVQVETPGPYSKDNNNGDSVRKREHETK